MARILRLRGFSLRNGTRMMFISHQSYADPLRAFQAGSELQKCLQPIASSRAVRCSPHLHGSCRYAQPPDRSTARGELDTLTTYPAQAPLQRSAACPPPCDGLASLGCHPSQLLSHRSQGDRPTRRHACLYGEIRTLTLRFLGWLLLRTQRKPAARVGESSTATIRIRECRRFWAKLSNERNSPMELFGRKGPKLGLKSKLRCFI